MTSKKKNPRVYEPSLEEIRLKCLEIRSRTIRQEDIEKQEGYHIPIYTTDRCHKNNSLTMGVKKQYSYTLKVES